MDYFLDMDKEFSLEENSKYVLIPVGYDGTSTFIKGADQGPQAILDASDSIELYDVALDLEAYKAGIHTDKPVFDFATPERMVDSVYTRVKHFLAKNKTVGLLGGEHSVSVGAIQATSEQYRNLSILQIDAHADLRDEYHGSAYNHACVMRRAQEFGNVVQVGIRSVCIEEKANIVEENIFYAHEIYRSSEWMQKSIGRLSENVYLTIDLDGLDPGVLPSTGTPLPGGLSWYTLTEYLQLLFREKNVVGFDVVELCPNRYDKSSDVLAAVLVYRIIGLFEKAAGRSRK